MIVCHGAKAPRNINAYGPPCVAMFPYSHVTAPLAAEHGTGWSLKSLDVTIWEIVSLLGISLIQSHDRLAYHDPVFSNAGFVMIGFILFMSALRRVHRGQSDKLTVQFLEINIRDRTDTTGLFSLTVAIVMEPFLNTNVTFCVVCGEAEDPPVHEAVLHVTRRELCSSVLVVRCLLNITGWLVFT
jgi:hypothetical protein